MSEVVVCGLQLGWGYVDSWNGRVVVARNWTFDEGSWRRSSRGDTARCLMLVSWDRSGRWMQLDGRCGQLRSGESLVNRCPGFDISLVWSSHGSLARNSESLRGLVVAMLGQSVTASRYVDWMMSCWSVVVGRSISRFWQYVGLTGGGVDLVASP